MNVTDGDGEVASEVDDAARYFDICQIVASNGAEEILLHQFFELVVTAGELDWNDSFEVESMKLRTSNSNELKIYQKKKKKERWMVWWWNLVWCGWARSGSPRTRREPNCPGRTDWSATFPSSGSAHRACGCNRFHLCGHTSICTISIKFHILYPHNCAVSCQEPEPITIDDRFIGEWDALLTCVDGGTLSVLGEVAFHGVEVLWHVRVFSNVPVRIEILLQLQDAPNVDTHQRTRH